MCGRKIVFSRYGQMTAAIGATCSQVPVGDHGFPTVTTITTPPMGLVAIGSNIFGRERCVFLHIPLSGQCRIDDGEAGFFRNQTRLIAVWTTGAVCSVVDASFPFMAAFAAPPNGQIAVQRHLCRREDTVFFCKPLLCKQWGNGGQIIEAGQHASAAANRTSSAIGAG